MNYLGGSKITSKVSAKIPQQKLFTKDGTYNIVQLKSHLMDEGTLEFQHMKDMLDKFTTIISKEPNMCEISGNVTIIGDIHGQYFDFMKILTKLGNSFLHDKLESHLLFLGDYVDRGANSVEVCTLIMALKINNPKKVTLLRGNHESRCMTTLYNFMTETVEKYNQDVYQLFMVAFDNLPLACLVNKNLFCVHGGLSSQLAALKEINKIDRFCEIPLEGKFCDLIWSDPVSNQSGQMSSETLFNDSRQCSIYFGKTLTKKFIQQNSIRTIVRAHEVFPEGYKPYSWGLNKKGEFPSVLTIFSAPNYCGVYGNRGAILKIQNGTHQIQQYKQQSVHKLYKYLQVLQWSIPLITDVINDFTKAMISSIFHIYLKKDFQKFQKESAATKLSVLMSYIKNQTNIMEEQNRQSKQSKQSKQKKNNDIFSSKLNKRESESQKQRLFNRSVQYFQKQHQRPDSRIFGKQTLKPLKQMQKTKIESQKLPKEVKKP